MKWCQLAVNWLRQSLFQKILIFSMCDVNKFSWHLPQNACSIMGNIFYLINMWVKLNWEWLKNVQSFQFFVIQTHAQAHNYWAMSIPISQDMNFNNEQIICNWRFWPFFLLWVDSLINTPFFFLSRFLQLFSWLFNFNGQTLIWYRIEPVEFVRMLF